MTVSKRGFLVLLFLVFFSLNFSCGPSDNEREKAIAAERLKKIASLINGDFIRVRNEVEKLAAFTATLYEADKVTETLKTVDTSRYRLLPSGVFYKPVDDGGSAVFVSGYTPVDEKIKQTVYTTEPLDLKFKAIIERYSEVAQVYYNDRYSYNRIYPYFDVISQYEPKMDIPAFNFYYLADETHNPEKKAIWVDEPYVDPAGRGWMVSVIAPVYVNGRLEGVPGLDITIETITKRYLDEKADNLLILDKSATIVSMQEYLSGLLSLPPLEKHKYLETIKMDTFRENDYNLLKSKDRRVRAMADTIFKQNRKETVLERESTVFLVLVEDIPELGWKLLLFYQ